MAVIEKAITEARGDLAQQFAVAAETLRRSTVQVRGRGPGAGSGVIWRSDGLVITNAHVARGPTAIIETWDGQVLDAELILRDAERDLAALTVKAGDLPVAPIGDSDTIRVGQLVVAVGNPFGLSGAAAMGIVHAIAPASGRGRQPWVQADIRLNPGNSGGPLADVQGRVVGVNSMVAGGLGLAVPSGAVERFLRNHGRRPRLGVTLQPVVVALGSQSAAVNGLLVLDVADGSPAEAAGIALGDVLIGIDGRPLDDRSDLASLPNLDAGATLRLDLLRAGKPMARVVVLSSADRGEEAGEAA